MSVRREESGFTLGEVLIAMFVLAVALMAMGKMQTRAIEAGEYSGRMSIALRVAQDVIEEVQRGGVLASGNDTVAYPHAHGGSTSFNRTWTVTDFPDWRGTLTTAREIVVTVTWGTGVGKQVVLRSLVT
jgi:prepilin-type N-terminal cleavage/methylation domain-containing protein